MFVTDRPVQIKAESRQGYFNVVYRTPCSSDWTDVMEIPDFQSIVDYMRLEAHESGTFQAAMDKLRDTEEKKRVTDMVECAVELCSLVVGHTLPQEIEKALDKAKEVDESGPHAPGRCTPFWYIPIELNGESMGLNEAVELLHMLPPPGNIQYQIAQVVFTTPIERNPYLCDDDDYLLQSADFIEKFRGSAIEREPVSSDLGLPPNLPPELADMIRGLQAQGFTVEIAQVTIDDDKENDNG